MKVVVFEYLTGGGLLSQSVPGSLLAEGLVMVRALVKDLLAIPGVAVAVFRDYRTAAEFPWNHSGVEDIRVTTDTDLRTAWRERLARGDAAWVIAPETDGILEQWCRTIEASGGLSLNGSAEAIRITASKTETARRLEAGGVPTIPVLGADAREFPIVVKPDDGVGCSGARIFRHPEDWDRWRHSADVASHVVQPLMDGDPLSLSVLFRHGEALLLSVNRQRIRVVDDRFVLTGCTVNVLSERRNWFQTLATRIAKAIPELWGYAGVDLIDTGRGCRVVEINPRLTTSYAGLYSALGINPAEMVVQLRRSGLLPPLARLRDLRVDVALEDRHDD